jgi:hypothetical protein
VVADVFAAPELSLHLKVGHVIPGAVQSPEDDMATAKARKSAGEPPVDKKRKKAVTKKAATKKATSKKAATKKATTKKAAAKKSTSKATKKAATKKSAAKKATAKKTAGKATAKKTTARKTAAKKATRSAAGTVKGMAKKSGAAAAKKTATGAAKLAGKAAAKKSAGRKVAKKQAAPRRVTPKQATAKMRELLEQKQEHDRQPQPWQALDTPGNGGGNHNLGTQSVEPAKIAELHAGESREKAIQGSMSSQDRRNQGKRDRR